MTKRFCPKKILILLAFAAASCQSSPPGEEGRQSEPQGHRGESIHLSAEQIKRANVRWGALESRSVAPSLKLAGELRIHPENRCSVGATADGVLSDLRARLNQPVQKGALLATLRKPDLIDLQQQYLENRDRLVFLQAEKDRYAGLKNENATSLKNYQKALSDFQAAATLSQTLAAKLRLLGIDAENLTAENLRHELKIHAPMSGTVTAIHASVGAALAMGQPICELADFSAMHADLFVYEKDVWQVKVGQKAAIFLPGAGPEEAVWATVHSIDRVLDKAKNAVRLHANVSLPPGRSLPEGMFFDAQLALGAPQSFPALPSDAVIREGLDNYVLLAKQAGEGVVFEAVKVRTMGQVDGYTAFEPATELPKGAQLVREGAYFVWSQGKVSEFGEEE